MRDRLRETYGRPLERPHGEPLSELVLTVLSQNTNDRNRDVAFGRLRERFPTWRAAAEAPVADLEQAIRPGGISRVKARRIKEILAALGRDGDLDLGWLEAMEPAQARAFLEGLPGVGRKTAACVLLFSFGQPELPVDTHVYRVTSRLGLIRPGASFEEAHDEMLRLVEPAEVYEMHMNLIRHGRRICRPRPRCGDCPLRRMCPYGAQVMAAARASVPAGR